MGIRGAIERKDAKAISGWIALRPLEGVPVVLEILVDNKVIGRVAADQFRPDVKAAGFGSGDHGFSFTFPPDMAPEKAASAEVRWAGTEIYLSKAEPAVDAVAPESPPAGAGSVFILGPARTGTSVTFLAMRIVLGLSGLGEGHVLPIFQRMLFNYYEYVKKFADGDGVLAGRLHVGALKPRMIDLIRQFYRDQFEGHPFIDKTPGLEALVGAPFVKEVFPAAKIIITTRNGVEVVESYRRKFNSTFEAACEEWARCAEQIALLRTTMPDVLFLDQNELRRFPEKAARRLADHLGRSDKTAALTEFFRTSREDVRSDAANWDVPLTLDNVGWDDREKL